VCPSLPRERSERWALIGALFDAVWVRGLHISKATVVQQLADDIGLPGAALVAEAQHEEVKARLRQQTNEAIAGGVFGVPTMAVGDELFWGYDDFPHLEAFLAGTDPLDPAAWEKWSAGSRPSAVRERQRRRDENA
jgi:2-hydroxychromene-2-carboxylate isomerase